MKQKSCSRWRTGDVRTGTETSASCFSLRNANVVILTDETEFGRLLTACWHAERQAPNITVLNSDLWREKKAPGPHPVVFGAGRDGKKNRRLRSLHSVAPASLFISCAFHTITQMRPHNT